jgi:hypothetical protein
MGVASFNHLSKFMYESVMKNVWAEGYFSIQSIKFYTYNERSIKKYNTVLYLGLDKGA